MEAPLGSPPSPSWRASLAVYRQGASLRMLALGFSAGLPLLLVLGTLSFRLREAGIERSTIGFLSWIGLAYGCKWLWAPLVDRLPLPLLTARFGRRRGWLLLAQLGVMAGLIGMALADPSAGLRPLVLCAIAVAFASATQDIALDAYRIESAAVEAQAALAAMYQTGYRMAMIWAGAGALWIAGASELAPVAAAAGSAGSAAASTAGSAVAALADTARSIAFNDGPWRIVYLVMALTMLIGMITVLFSPEPATARHRETLAEEAARAGRYIAQRGWSVRRAALVAWLQGAVIGPFADFIARYKWHALLLLSLIATYRIADVVMGIMANPFYVDMGYSKQEVATISKSYGVLMTLLGAFIGGVVSLRIGVMRTLFFGALLSAASNLLFAWLATRGHDPLALTLVVSADNLAGGLASSAFIGYLSGLTRLAYSATQYALFSSVMLLLPKFVAGFSGVFVDRYGYQAFFIGTALLGVPVLILVTLAARAARAARAESKVTFDEPQRRSNEPQASPSQ